MSKFFEYLDSSGKIRKPEVDIRGNKVDMPEGKKNYPPGSKQSYQAKKMKKSSEGFGKLRSPNIPADCCDPEKEVKPAKIPTAESPYDLAPVLRESMRSDPRVVEVVIRDLKNNNLLGMLIGELLLHRESYEQIASVMASKNHGQKVCNKLVTAIREVSAPYSSEFDIEPEEEEDLPDEETEEEEPDLFDDEDEEEDMPPPSDEDDEETNMLKTGDEMPKAPALEHLIRAIRTLIG